jgi:hypothetical protein
MSWGFVRLCFLGIVLGHVCCSMVWSYLPSCGVVQQASCCGACLVLCFGAIVWPCVLGCARGLVLRTLFGPVFRGVEWACARGMYLVMFPGVLVGNLFAGRCDSVLWWLLRGHGSCVTLELPKVTLGRSKVPLGCSKVTLGRSEVNVGRSKVTLEVLRNLLRDPLREKT